jgi:hypothetical protein
MTEQKREWVSTLIMAKHFGIHYQTLLKVRRKGLAFKEGHDFRYKGLTTSSRLQWHKSNAEETYNSFTRLKS